MPPSRISHMFFDITDMSMTDLREFMGGLKGRRLTLTNKDGVTISLFFYASADWKDDPLAIDVDEPASGFLKYPPDDH